MGFLNESSSGPSIYTEITEEVKLVRPLLPKPSSVWCHKIQRVARLGPDGKEEVIRSFAHETCTATNRSGTGCYLCNNPDPLWHMLSAEEQTNKVGKRVDFPKTPLHYMPVFEPATKAVTVIKGGNMIFKPMDEWYDTQAGNNQDLRRCDWGISKAGKSKRTQYKTTRMDVSPFPISPELEAQAKLLFEKAMEDRRPTSPEKLGNMIRGLNMEMPSGLPPTQEVRALPAAQPVAQVAPPPQWTAPVAQQQIMPQVTASITPTVSVVASAGSAAGKSSIDSFVAWATTQPEFAGLGMMNTFIPAIKKAIGHVEYHKLSEQQLAQLRSALEAELAAIRTK